MWVLANSMAWLPGSPARRAQKVAKRAAAADECHAAACNDALLHRRPVEGALGAAGDAPAGAVAAVDRAGVGDQEQGPVGVKVVRGGIGLGEEIRVALPEGRPRSAEGIIASQHQARLFRRSDGAHAETQATRSACSHHRKNG